MSRTRMQRRRLRRLWLYRITVLALFAAVVALTVTTVRYGRYLTKYAEEHRALWSAADTISYLPENAHTLEYEVAMKAASDRYEREQEWVLYEVFLAKKETTDGGKPSAVSDSQ